VGREPAGLVEQMPHRDLALAVVLRPVVDEQVDRRVQVLEQSVGDRDRREHAGEGLGAAGERVRALGRPAAGVALEDHFTALEHQERPACGGLREFAGGRERLLRDLDPRRADGPRGPFRLLNCYPRRRLDPVPRHQCLRTGQRREARGEGEDGARERGEQAEGARHGRVYARWRRSLWGNRRSVCARSSRRARSTSGTARTQPIRASSESSVQAPLSEPRLEAPVQPARPAARPFTYCSPTEQMAQRPFERRLAPTEPLLLQAPRHDQRPAQQDRPPHLAEQRRHGSAG
jgi:hypothetical protein